jgi:hypothetical protein
MNHTKPTTISSEASAQVVDGSGTGDVFIILTWLAKASLVNRKPAFWL